MTSKINTTYNYILVFLLGLLPITVVSSHSLPSIVYYLALFFSLLIIINNKNNLLIVYKRYRYLVFSLLFPMGVALLAALYNKHFSGRDFEAFLRFFLGTVLILFALCSIPKKDVQKAIFGYFIAGIVSSVFVLYIAWPNWNRPNTKAMYNAVIYANLIFMFVITSFFSLRISITKKVKTEFILKVLLLVFIFAAFVITQTRTTWLAMPALILVSAFLFTDRLNIKKLVAILLGSVLLLGLFYVNNDTLMQRANRAVHEVAQCRGEGKNTESSLCIRLQLWRASVDMAKDHPMGIGDRKKFTKALQNESLPKGIVTKKVAKWWEPHSDLFLYIATFGWLGGLAMLLIYAVPSFIFLQRLSYKNQVSTRTYAAMGIVFCIAFFVAGFGDTMFRLMRLIPFYAFSVAFFLRMSDES